MERPPLRFVNRSLEPLGRRLRRLWLRHGAGRFVHGHRVSQLRIGQRTFKRIRFGDAWLADRTARALEHFSGSGVLPELEARFDEELLVEFIEGERLARFDAGAAEAMAAFYARIHERDCPEVDLEQARVLEEAARNLSFLRDTGIVQAAEAVALGDALDRLAPARVRLGWDYTDAVPKNFVWRDGGLVGIDVEALRADGLVGIGIAKSLARGEAGYREAFLDAFRKVSPIDVEATLPFTELCFQLRWLKNRCLKGSPLDLGGLARFLDPVDPAGR